MNLTVREVLGLRVNDIIRLQSTHVSDQMALKVGDRKKFWCRPGQVGSKLAVQITENIESIEAEEFEELAADEGE